MHRRFAARCHEFLVSRICFSDTEIGIYAVMKEMGLLGDIAFHCAKVVGIDAGYVSI